MSVSRFLKRYPMESGGVAIAAIALITSIPGMLQNSQMMGEISKQIQQDSARQQRLEAQQEALKAREQIAIRRYNSGCLPIQMRNQNKLIGLAEGMRVVDNTTGLPIPPETCVVDYQGGTAVISNDGMAMDFAFTGDRETIRKALERSGIRLMPGRGDYGSSNRTFEKGGQQ